MSQLTAEPAGLPRARQMLQRAAWAARAYADYDAATVRRIVAAVAAVAEGTAGHDAAREVDEAGRGVVEHRATTNRLCSRDLTDSYAARDYVSPRVDAAARTVEIPRAAGVILGLTPSAPSVATLYAQALLALMTRNALVLSPHPRAQACCVGAARTLHAAAVEAGAPDGVIQVIDRSSGPLVRALMVEPRTDLILTGGGVVRVADGSGTPLRGVVPSPVPVLVDATADLPAAASRLVDSKSFDNSLLPASESVAIVEEQVAERLLRELARQGGYVCDAAEVARLRDVVFRDGQVDPEVVGRSAVDIAAMAEVPCSPRTRILVTPFDVAVSEEPLAHGAACPVLGLVRVPTAARGIRAAAAVVRIGGHSRFAVIHSEDPAAVLAYAAALPVRHLTVNAAGSPGSSLWHHLEPEQLVTWARIAYSGGSPGGMPSFAGIDPCHPPVGAVPAYPVASNMVASA